MRFTPAAPAFLDENYMRNDKEWFKANREVYDREVSGPFKELVGYLAPIMEKIDPEIVCTPRKISRIYRDVRLMKDGRVFKRSIWVSLRRPKVERFDSKPEFYFWINPDNFGWGCGYYRADTDVMQKMRELILKGDKAAKDAIEFYEGQRKLVLQGEMYKRDRFPEADPAEKKWLNRKHPSVSFVCEDPEVFFSEGLEKKVGKDFQRMAPIYGLFIKAEELAAADRAEAGKAKQEK